MAKPLTKSPRKPAKPPEPRAPQWRFREFYDALGGAEGIIARLTTAGYAPPPIMTVRGWAHRRSIPSKWLLALLIVGIRDKVIADVSALDAGDAA